MRYPISKVSKIVGISAEAVRLYEKKGVVHPQRNAKNGYRSFHTLDIGTLIRCRTYAQMGLSLNDTAEMINNADVGDVYNRIREQEAVMENNLEMQSRALRRIHDLNEQIHKCQEEENTFRVETHPGLYHLDYRHNTLILDDEEHMQLYPSWSSWVPLSFVSLRFPLDSLLLGEREYYAGFGVMEEDARFLNIAASRLVVCYPAHLSVRCILRIHGERPIEPTDFVPAMNFIRSSGLKLVNDPYTRMIVTVKRNQNDFVRYYEMWLPVCIQN